MLIHSKNPRVKGDERSAMTVFDLDIPVFEFAAVFQISFTAAVFEVARFKRQRTFKCTEYCTIGVSFPILTDIT